MENWFLVIEGLIYPSLTPLTLADLLLLFFGINQGNTKSGECKHQDQVKYLLSHVLSHSK